jgi:hypothetical protein
MGLCTGLGQNSDACYMRLGILSQNSDINQWDRLSGLGVNRDACLHGLDIDLGHGSGVGFLGFRFISSEISDLGGGMSITFLQQ